MRTGLATDFLPSNETEVYVDVMRVNNTYYGRLCGNYGGGEGQGMFAIHHDNVGIAFDFGTYRTTLKSPAESYPGKRYTAKYGQSGVFINGVLVGDVPVRPQFKATLPMYIFTVPQATTAASGEYQVFRFTVYDAGEIVFDFIPTLDAAGSPCMFDTVTRKPFYNIGTEAFIVGIENQTQLNNLLRKLPDRTGQDVGTLHVRLADELQTPENEAKLDAMLAKNWEISQAA